MTLYFQEPRLNLNAFGEFLVQTATYASYALLSSAAAVAVFPGATPSLRWFGVLLFLFLGDRLLHIGEGERALDELKGERANAALAMTPGAYRVVNRAFRKTAVVGGNFYLALLVELAERRDVRESLRRLDVSPKTFIEKLERLQGSRDMVSQEGNAADKLRVAIAEFMTLACGSARATGERFIEARNVFAALTAVQDKALVQLFESLDIASSDVQEVILFGRWRKRFAWFRRIPSVLGGFAHRPRFLRHRVMNRAWTARPTPVLDRFSSDLTDLARSEQVGLLIGHDEEFEEMTDVLARLGKPNVLLVGEPGAGKSTMVSRLAFRLIKDQVPAALFDKRLISLNVASLIAEASPEILTGRLRTIVEEVIAAGNIILFIPNMHDFFRTAEARSLNAIDVLLPLVQNVSIPIIGETYPREFKRFIEQRSDFLDQFEVVQIVEITPAEAVRFLVYTSLLLEEEYRTLITFRAVKRSVSIAHRYFRNKLLPGSALDLLKEALARAEGEGKKTVDERLVIAVAERKSKIPIQEAGSAEAEKLLHLEEAIHERFVNQEAAVQAVSRSLREYRSGLTRRGGPIASFLFVGPTGVGKTELSKILAGIQFGSKDAMHRFDMSEFQEKQSISRLIGSPDGSQTGALTDAVLANPYSLVLLDEFEKAHPDILNLFLQVFDDGRLTDSLNRTADFEHAIIVATSNAHSEFIKEALERGTSMEAIEEELKKKLTAYFKPELLNRFSDVIVFRGLNRGEIYQIARLLLQDVESLLRETHGIELRVRDDALGRIAELGYSPVFGARPLRQVISEKVKSALAEKILRNEARRGSALELVLEDGDLALRAARENETPSVVQ